MRERQRLQSNVITRIKSQAVMVGWSSESVVAVVERVVVARGVVVVAV